MRLFEFGKYWDTYTYLLILFIGSLICIFSKKGAMATPKSRINICGNGIQINIWYFFLFLLFIILYTFKDVSYGADSAFYVMNFQASTTFYNAYNVEIEPLFNVFTYVIRKISDNYTIYFFLASLIVASGYVNFIKTFWQKNCEFLLIMLVAVQFFYDMNIMRAGIGCAFILHSFCCLKNNKIGRSIFLTIIGTGFHYTLIINIPFIACYIILKNKNKFAKAKVIALFLVVAATTLGMTYICQKFIGNTIYKSYFKMKRPTLIGNWYLILSMCQALAISYRRVVNDIRIRIAVVGALFSAILIIPVMGLGAYRLPVYFYMLRILVWGYALKNQKKIKMDSKIRKILAFSIVIFYSLFVLSRRSSDYGFSYSFIKLF